MLKVVVFLHCIIQLVHLSPKPRLVKHVLIKYHFKLLYPFSISSFMTMYPPLVCLFKKVLSYIRNKELQIGDIIGKCCSKQLVNSLEIIL